MEEKFSVSLELMIEKFKAKAQQTQNIAKNVSNKIKENMSADVGDGAFKGMTAESELLYKQITRIKAILDTPELVGKMTPSKILEFRVELEKLERQYDKINSSSNEFSNSFDKIQDGLKKSMQKAKRFTLSLFGIQSVYRMLSRASSAYLAQDTETSSKIQAAWIGLGSIFAPILEKVANFVIKAVKYINVFIKALTGTDFLANAMAKSMNKANKSAGKLSKTLAGFDELTNLDSDTGGASVDTSWIDAFKNLKLDPNITAFFENLGNALKPVYEGVMKIVEWFQTLDSDTQTLMITLGIGGLLGLLTGKGGLVLGFGAVGFGVLGLTKIFDEDLTTSAEGLMSLLGAAGLVGVLVGGSKGLGVAGAIAGVSFALFGLNEYINGDTTEAIEGLILLLGGAGLAGVFIGGTKGASVGLAIGSVIAILKGFNDLLSGDTTKQIKGFIGLVTGSAGLLVALQLIRGGAKAGLLGIITPLTIMVTGFVALAAGIYAVVTNWSKMTGLEKVISVLGLVAIAAATAAAAVGALQSAWTLGIAAVAIAGGVAAIASSISKANKRAQENIPKLAVGTPNVEKSGYAMIHEGEAVVPKKFNSSEYFSGGNDETNNLLRVLIETLEEKDMSVSIDKNSIGQASADYINSQKRIMGRGVI